MTRVFVLCTGRSGSTTFTRAMEHATNYTAAHESRGKMVQGRLNYPDHHVEVDNRLAWFLGLLDETYGDGPFYVHLTRDREQTAVSFSERFHGRASIVRAFGQGIIMRPNVPTVDRLEVSRLCVDTIEANIRLFLRDKTKVEHVQVEDFEAGFRRVWDRIRAEGDLEAAVRELSVRYNKRPKGSRGR